MLSCHAFSDDINECLSDSETTTRFEVSTIFVSTQPPTIRSETTGPGDRLTTVQQEETTAPPTTAPPIAEATTAPLLDWASWTSCSVTCGDGTQTRSRPDCSYAPELCNEEQNCNLGECPGWGNWRPWGICSGTY